MSQADLLSIDKIRELAKDPDQLEAMRQVCRRRAKESLWYFAYHCCGFEDIDSKLHHTMCEVWQQRREAKRTLWLVPRGHLKTSLWTIAGTLWELLQDKDLRILVNSSTDKLAEAFIADVRSIIERNETFRWLFPEYCYDLAEEKVRRACFIRKDRLDIPCSKWYGRKEGAINAGSTESTATGRHFDLRIYDDVVHEKNSQTPEMLEKTHVWFRNQKPLQVNSRSRERVIGTRWDYDDIYGRIIRDELVRRKEAQEQGKPYTPMWLFFRLGCWQKNTAGEYVLDKDGNKIPIWPEWYSYEDLEEIRKDMNSYLFSCQYLNEPVPPDDAYFRREDIKRIDDPAVPINVNTFIAVDMADEESISGDYTVVVVASFDSQDRMYVRQVIRERRLQILNLVEYLGNLTRKWHPVRVGVETAVFQKSIYRHYKTEALRKGIQIPWCELKHDGKSKTRRIAGLSPRVQRGDFYAVHGLQQYDDMEDEMAHFPRGASDDILDALAYLNNMSYSAATPSGALEEGNGNQFDAIGAWSDRELSLEQDSNPDLAYA